MAEITKRRTGELTRKAYEVLLTQPDGLPAKAVLDRVEQAIPLTDFERSTYPSRPDVRRFEKIARFGTIAHVKAGWLLKEKGRWSITEAGKRAYEQFKDPEKFQREADRLYRQWAEARPEEPDTVEIETDLPDTTSTFEEAEETAWAEIERQLREMSPFDFQNMVAALLRAMGYFVSWVSPPGRDGGIDILAHTDPLGTKPPRIKVEVKRRADKVTVDGLRSFMALLGDGDVGLFVSTGGFTSDAETEARTQEKRKITLLGLERLFDLWVEHYDKIDEPDRQFLPLKPVYYLAPPK